MKLKLEKQVIMNSNNKNFVKQNSCKWIVIKHIVYYKVDHSSNALIITNFQ